MCLICDAENQYLRQGENCEYCEAGKADDLGAWAFLIVCCFLLMIVVFLGISCTTVVRGMDKEREHLKHVNRDSIKILIGYMQVLSVMTVSYSSVQWPSGFKSYSQGMSVVNFDLAFLMPISFLLPQDGTISHQQRHCSFPQLRVLRALERSPSAPRGLVAEPREALRSSAPIPLA